ncbi:putative peptidyl-arginine deiminase family protein [Cadophora sp. DSE1049]|nr:putative peptidyl-arginine deiminase family protein [Cadophora sp. DSE1049]
MTSKTPTRHLPRYFMPAEHSPHTHTLMAFPTSLSLYPHQLQGARSEILNIATAISKFEPVIIFVHPDDSRELSMRLQESSMASSENMTVKEVELESLWIRDTGPVFVLKEGENLRGVDFGFNYWGQKLPPASDIGLAKRISNLSNIEKIDPGVVAEGGGIEVDGEGTLLACESSIVNENRNPGMSRDVVEEKLKGVLGVEKIIWLTGVQGEDITDCHVDALARFVRPGMVVLSRPHGGRGGVWMDVFEDAKRTLERETDARGRSFKVVEIEEPELDLVEQEPESSENGKQFSSVFSYVNYLLVNGGVIAPKFGDEKRDQICREVLEGLFLGRKVVQVHINILPRAGGGVHCATQQVTAG